MKKERDKFYEEKVISILLTAVLATGMAACGSNNSAADTSADNTTGNAESTTEASDDSATKPVLTVGMEGTYAPYTYHDENGTLTGFEVDMANAIGEKWDMMLNLLKQSGIPSLLHLMPVILMQL